jgi:ribonuclease PH
MQRRDGRSGDEIRKPRVIYDVYRHAAGSTLFSLGNTTVLCSVMLQHGVPPFLKGKQVGWLTAEYGMLPASTQVRMVRDSSSGKRNGRAIEISRLIGRALRSVVRVAGLGEYTIAIDCDVLHADGGTRTAAINGAYLALRAAQTRWLRDGIIKEPIIREEIAAISVGVVNESIMLDLTYAEDSSAQADCNFVLTRSGKVIEIQSSSEREPMSWEHMMRVQVLAQQGIEQLFTWLDGQQESSTFTEIVSRASDERCTMLQQHGAPHHELLL